MSPFSCSEGKVSSSETSLVHCNVSGESLPRSSDSRRARTRGQGWTRIWSGNGSGFTPFPARPRPAPADGSPLSLPSDPHIPHSVHPAPRSPPALRCPTPPCCWFCGRRRAILPPFALPLSARPTDRGFPVRWAHLCIFEEEGSSWRVRLSQNLRSLPHECGEVLPCTPNKLDLLCLSLFRRVHFTSKRGRRHCWYSNPSFHVPLPHPYVSSIKSPPPVLMLSILLCCLTSIRNHKPTINLPHFPHFFPLHGHRHRRQPTRPRAILSNIPLIPRKITSSRTILARPLFLPSRRRGHLGTTGTDGARGGREGGRGAEGTSGDDGDGGGGGVLGSHHLSLLSVVY